MKKHLSLNVEPKVYQEVKNAVPAGQVGKFVNNILKEYFKKQKTQELKEAYKRTAKSKEMREENKVWEGSIEDGINE